MFFFKDFVIKLNYPVQTFKYLPEVRIQGKSTEKNLIVIYYHLSAMEARTLDWRILL